jgi:hypothetical protein
VRRVLTNRFYLSVNSRPVPTADFSSPGQLIGKAERSGQAPSSLAKPPMLNGVE